MGDHSKRDAMLRHVIEAARSQPKPDPDHPKCSVCHAPAKYAAYRARDVTYYCAEHLPAIGI